LRNRLERPVHEPHPRLTVHDPDLDVERAAARIPDADPIVR